MENLKQRTLLYTIMVLFSSFASSMYTIVVGWILYEISGNAFYSGMMVGIGFLPGLILNLFFGVIVDRVDRWKITLLSSGISTIVVLILLVTLKASIITAWVIVVLHVVLQLASSLSRPAMQALIGQLFDTRDYAKVIGTSTSLGELGYLLGASATGFLLVVLPEYLIVLIILLFSIGSLFCLYSLKPRNNEKIVIDKPKKSIVLDLVEGFSYLKKNPVIYGLLGMGFVGQLVLHSSGGLLPVYTKSYLEQTSKVFGLLESTLSIGAIFAGLGTTWLFYKVKGYLGTYSIATILLGTLCLGLSKSLILTFISIFLLGLGTTFLRVSTQSMQQIITDPLYHGRMSSYRMVINQGSVVIGSPILGLISEKFGANFSYLALSAPLIITMIYSVIFLSLNTTRKAFSTLSR